ncbi:MAG TPA: alpha/beta hydrolase domain-containing protein [Vicinamibacterales bacterium]|nr:alpha/beta hydrolase domain-containing protein [Vicinamibacterales bacterium]
MRASRIVVVAAVSLTIGASALIGQEGGQFPGGGRGRAGGSPPAPSNLPETPTAVTLPSISAEVTGPGPIFDSAPSLAPGKGLDAFKYEAHEYFVSGTANGEPYTTRIVVRRPADNSKFSGLVLTEAMHGSGAAHMFEFTSIYTMSSGHAAVEILTTPPAQFVALNEARYRTIKLSGTQTNEILAQVGSLVRSGSLVGGPVRKMVLAGTSMTAGVLINYLPAHMVYRTPQMQRIYDGFLPMSNGAMIREVDVPLIHVPTMHEVSGNITNRQDGDEPGKQYRLYEFSGMGHIDTRDSVRMHPNPCVDPLSAFPVQAYMSVALDHLLRWVDAGTVPPRADRILLDRNQYNDGSMMALDEHGNPRGGVRTTYVDVPTSKYVIRPAATTPVIPNASAYIATRGQNAANQMCGLSTAQIAFAPAKLKELYKNKQGYVKAVEARLTALEKAGWSLPLYREMILGDAAKVSF